MRPHFGHCAISRNRSGSLMSGPCSASSREVRSRPCRWEESAVASQNGARGNCPFGRAVHYVYVVDAGRLASYATVMGDDLIAWGLVFAPLVLIYGGTAACICLRRRVR